MKKIFSLILMLILLVGCANNDLNESSSISITYDTGIIRPKDPNKIYKESNIKILFNDNELTTFGEDVSIDALFVHYTSLYNKKNNVTFGYTKEKTFDVIIKLSEGYDKENTYAKIVTGFVSISDDESFAYEDLMFETNKYYSVVYNSDNIILSIDITNLDVEIEGLVVYCRYIYSETNEYSETRGYQYAGIKFISE